MELVSIFTGKHVTRDELCRFVVESGGTWTDAPDQGVIEDGKAHVFVSLGTLHEYVDDEDDRTLDRVAQELGCQARSVIALFFSPGIARSAELVGKIGRDAANKWKGYIHAEPEVSSLLHELL